MLKLDSSLRRATWSYYYETLVPKLQIQNVEQLLLHKKTDLFSISAICAYKVTNNFNTALSFLLETQRFNSTILNFLPGVFIFRISVATTNSLLTF